MARSTPVDDQLAQVETRYSLVGVDLPRLLQRVAGGVVSPEQAEAQLRISSQPWVRGLRAVFISLIGLVFLGVGLFLLRYAWQANAEARQFDRHSRQTNGTVVALNRHVARNSRVYVCPDFYLSGGGNRIPA